MAYIVDMNKLDECGKDFRKYINNNILFKIHTLNNLFKEIGWEGAAKNAYCELYERKLKDLFNFADMLEKFGYYMQFVAEKYNEVNVNSQEEFQKFVDYMHSQKPMNDYDQR